MNKKLIPLFVSHVTETLQKAGFEAYLVGGAVRDLIRLENNQTTTYPKDWDIATNALPTEIIKTFDSYKTLNNNNFGTVTVLNLAKNEADREEVSHVTEKVEITTYRSEGIYSDYRRPDKVSYETNIEKDLERRDFTMNAIAWDPIKDIIIDIYKGQKDIKDKIIRSVLNADDRFQEDALRMLRAIRFAVNLDFAIENETYEAIERQNQILGKISQERIRDEFIKIITSQAPALGITLLEKSELLKYIIPEIYESIGCEQKGAHIYDVYQHLLHALQHAADKDFQLEIRLAALFHDIGKPATRRFEARKNKYTFFGHEVVGAKMTKKILERLRFSRETIDLVVKLVRNHMFFSDTDQITLSAVRRIIKKVGPEHIWDLMKVRECDRVGMKKAEAPIRLRKYHAMIEEVLHDPISVAQLAIDGKYLIEVLHMKPGPRMGWVLHALLEMVLDNPTLNNIEQLKERAQKLLKLSDSELQKLGEKGKEKRTKQEEAQIANLRQKHNIF